MDDLTRSNIKSPNMALKILFLFDTLQVHTKINSGMLWLLKFALGLFQGQRQRQAIQVLWNFVEKFALNGSNDNGDDETDDVVSRHDDVEGLIGDIACWLDGEMLIKTDDPLLC